ncbi:Oligopeptide transport ATP-binding protein AppF [Candidatus Protochlamydia amoebophila]|uniref:Oligopeptide transport ATP-binding protein AppF n=2 Tax=Candidatus Protochlamydia amoebophila TaxID=362787 RepID=A0A0C1JTE8_9BACT|nr:Oligopeptide transport ATP-binding protein AppF [Candidatus Protochlamydia amoebophila]
MGEAMTEFLLCVKGLKKYFPIMAGLFRKEIEVFKAVDDIDFSIKTGEVLGMVGESGSGKSTAARAAVRLIEPTEGQILFSGQSLRDLSKNELKKIRKNIQIVFQDPYASLNPRKTILDSIGEALFYHGIVKTKEEQIEKVVDVLQKIGLSPDIMNRYPHEFSGGQQQRICIGRAIALNPKLIICDEAVSALDVSIQAQILNLLIELKETLDLSYLFISHDLSVIKHIADNIVVLYKGKIIESGSNIQIFENPQSTYTKELLNAIPRLRPRQSKTKNIT